MLDRLSHFDVNVRFTAGKNIPLTDYLSRHPIVPTKTTELENKADGLNEAEAEEEFVINQIYGLLEFNQKRGSIKRFTEQNATKENFDQSQSDNNTHERNQNTQLRKASLLPNNIVPKSFETLSSSNSKMDKVNGIDMEFIYKKGVIPPKLNACGSQETTSSNRTKPELWGREKKVKEFKNTDLTKRAASESRS